LVKENEMIAREIAHKILSAALESVDPFLTVKEYADKIRSDFLNENSKNLIVVGFGKASYQMAKAVEESMGIDLITSGIVITKYGHAESLEFGVKSSEFGIKNLKKIKVFEAGHPIPDENGLNATEKIINLLKDTDEKTLVLCLISGGGSALFVSPYDGITLSEKQKITDLLLKVGANINELNTVRKHISKVKGGRLAEITHPAKIITLIISDVIGDKLDVIASGPTSPDNTTFNDALNVIDKFNLSKKAPESVVDILSKGKQGMIPETPKEDNPVFKNVKNLIICNNMKALNAAKNKAQALGFRAEIISSDISGEASEVGRWLAEKAIRIKDSRGQGVSRCLISGGETTVTVTGEGKGGRNMELALSFAMTIEGIDGITLLSAGTDGTDGPTDAAGAIVDGTTIEEARNLGLDPAKYLENNDSYNFFKQIDSLLITGPTGTNVMDVQIVLVSH
jgi:hydroxypyruvate reductase/glycerate 2-kinase